MMAKYSKGLKADLHLHTCDSPKETHIKYDAFKLIDAAMHLGYEVLSITNHDTLTYSDFLKDYAEERGILLIPGMELTLHKKHVLMYTTTNSFKRPTAFGDLEKTIDKNNLLVAPHPFFPSIHSLGKHLIRWQNIFDAIELCHFYTNILDFNQEALAWAKNCNLPVLGTSDSHSLRQLNTTYSVIYAEKDSEAIFEAIKYGNLSVVTAPLPTLKACRILYDLFIPPALQHAGTACFYLMSLLLRS